MAYEWIEEDTKDRRIPQLKVLMGIYPILRLRMGIHIYQLTNHATI